MAFDAFSCPSGARPSRVYVRYVERRPESSVPAANGHGTRPEPRREFRGHAPLPDGGGSASEPRCVSSWVSAAGKENPVELDYRS